MYNLQELKRIRNNLVQKKQSLESELDLLPDGVLYSSRSSNGKWYYGVRIPPAGNRKKTVRAGINKDPDKLAGLVRKKYVVRAIGIIKANIDLIDVMIDKYVPSDENSLMKEFMIEHPEVSDSIYSASLFDYNSWGSDYKDNEGMFSENLRSISSEGVSMRSMGEIAIASRLDHFGIPYRYEASLGIPELAYVPDFTIRRPRDDKLFYWEHLGMVNDPDYMRHNKRKIEVYENYGIVPWRNLIVTYGTEDGGINMKIVDAMIQGWLL